MRLSTFKTALAQLLLVMAALFYATSAEAACFLQQDETDIDTSLIDTTNTISRYDRRIHHYRKQWNSLIPTQHVILIGNFFYYCVPPVNDRHFIVLPVQFVCQGSSNLTTPHNNNLHS